jgi:transposase
LEEYLFPWIERLGATKFLQDGVQCHTSKKMMASLREKKNSVMDWPVNSLDLNPIENLWAIMKARLKRIPNITSLHLLVRVKNLSNSLMNKLVHCMPRRL